jgi:hypothetical protein
MRVGGSKGHVNPGNQPRDEQPLYDKRVVTCSTLFLEFLLSPSKRPDLSPDSEELRSQVLPVDLPKL